MCDAFELHCIHVNANKTHRRAFNELISHGSVRDHIIMQLPLIQVNKQRCVQIRVTMFINPSVEIGVSNACVAFRQI